MVSEIKGPGAGAIPALEQPKATSQTPAATQAQASGLPAGERVELTDRASQLQALTQAVADQPEVDRGAVVSLRAELAAGEFAVNPTTVAEKLIEFERVLQATG